MDIDTTGGSSADPVAVAIRSLRTMATGGRSDFDAVFHPDAVNRENKLQPPSSRVPGPAGFHSTALWLRAAFAGLHYEIHHALTDGDLVAVNSTMNGRHVAQFVLYRDDGEVDTAFPHRQELRNGADTLVSNTGRQGHRALGGSRRFGAGQATRLATTNSGVSGPDGVGKASGQALRPPRASTTA
jgi:hypothetical protein